MHDAEGMRSRLLVMLLSHDTAELSVVPYGQLVCDFQSYAYNKPTVARNAIRLPVQAHISHHHDEP
jgi:hypothetical protein